MSKAQLIEKAKAFGIDTEGLGVDALKAAIKAAKEAGRTALEKNLKDADAYLNGLATDAPEEIKQAALEAVTTAKSDLDTYIALHFPPNPFAKPDPGAEGSGGDTGDEQEDKKGTQAPPAANPTATAPAKSKKAKRTVFTLGDVDYAFAKNTPERFNFLGKNKTKEEWMADDAAMELLIQGRFQYIKQIKK